MIHRSTDDQKVLSESFPFLENEQIFKKVAHTLVSLPLTRRESHAIGT